MSAIGLKLNDYWNEKKNGQTGSGPTKSTSRCVYFEEKDSYRDLAYDLYFVCR